MKNYFTEADFDKASPPCKMSDMNPATLDRFNQARDIAGIPFKVISAYRTVTYERIKGRPGTSAHTTGHAMDIACTDGAARYTIVRALMQAGFTRIGIDKAFIHADDSPDKAQGVIWLY